MTPMEMPAINFITLAKEDFEKAFEIYLGPEEYARIKDTSFGDLRREEMSCYVEALEKHNP